MSKRILIIFLMAFFCGEYSFSQSNYNYFISNLGIDTNPGTSKLLPKQTIAGTALVLKNYAATNGNVALGLKNGDIFNEALVATYPIQIGVYNDTAIHPDFAILNGSKRFDSGWYQSTGTMHTYTQNIMYSGFTGSGINGIGNYSIIYVIEIDKQLESTNPFSARKILQFASNAQGVDSIPGSFYHPLIPLGTGNGAINISVHTSNDNSPNGNAKYRYEVTVRDKAVDAYNNNNNRFENLWVRGYGAGYGSLPGGSNSYYNKIIFGPGAAIHHVVTKNGFLNNCLFLPGPKHTNGGALVFYDVQGFGRHNKISNSIFLDIKTPIYAHTSGGSSFGAVELDNVIAFADTSDTGGFMSTSNNDSVLIYNTYTDNYPIGFNYSSANFLKIDNTNFTNTKRGLYFGRNYITAYVDNVFINSKGKDNVSGIVMQSNTFLKLTNSIIHINNSNKILNPDPVGLFIEGSGSTNHIDASGNIFVCDVEQSKLVIAATANNDNGIGSSLDTWSNNVYVLLRGNRIVWNVTNAALNGGSKSVQTFAEWQRQSGQDKNSLFFDLRNDPRGLKAIFIDPDNGNYELANTVEGNKIVALKAGMINPLRCFLKKPTYEEAAEIIRSDKVLTASSCRNPCQQTKAKVSFSVAPDASGVINLCQNSELTMEGSGDFLQNDIYYHQSNAKQRYLWWSSDGQDTMGTNLHSLTQKFLHAGLTDVRLQMVDENGCSYDTIFTINVIKSAAKPDLGKDTSLCTGQSLPLKVINNQANDVYTWSTGATGTTRINVTEAGDYWVKYQDNAGCFNYDTVRVINKTPISVSFGGDTLFCATGTNILSAVTTGQVKAYRWSTGAAANNIKITAPGMYAVTAKDFGVCIATDTINIAGNPVNTFSLPADTAICVGSTFLLTLAPPPFTTITWSDGTAGYRHPIKEGLFAIVADNAGCLRTDSILVITKPLPVVKLINDTSICNGFDFPLSVNYPGATYLWSTGSTDHTISARNKGTYWVEASLNGCSFRDSVYLGLNTCPCSIKIPNAFSPNGDGINDVMQPEITCFPNNYNLSVFNRYGQVVFTSKNYQSHWDGKFNGRPLAEGTYYYILNFSNESLPQNKPISGSITLLR